MEEVKPRIIRDLVENSKAAIRWYYDNNNALRMRYVDIVNLFHSYTNDPFFNNLDYAGERILLTIREIRKMSDGKLSEADFFNIAKLYADKEGNTSWLYGGEYNVNGNYQGRPYNYDDYRIPCLDFVFYTTDVYKWESRVDKYGNQKVNRKPFDYNKTYEESKYERELIRKDLEMEYEGLWVIGSEYMVNYGRSKNITRPKVQGKMTASCLKKYIIVQPALRYGFSKSLVEIARPNVDSIQVAVLRKRHFMAEAMPPGLAIDWDSLVEISTAMKLNH